MLLHRDALQSVLSFLVPEGDLLLSARRVSHDWRVAAALEHSAGFRRRHAEQKQLQADREDPAELLRLLEAAEPTSSTIHRVRLLSRQSASPLPFGPLIRLLASSPSRKLQLELVCLPCIHNFSGLWQEASVLREHAAAILPILMRLIQGRDPVEYSCAVELVRATSICICRMNARSRSLWLLTPFVCALLCSCAALAIGCGLPTIVRCFSARAIFRSLTPTFVHRRLPWEHIRISKFLQRACELPSLDERDLELAAACLPVLTNILLDLTRYGESTEYIGLALRSLIRKVDAVALAPLLSRELLSELVDLLMVDFAKAGDIIPWNALMCVEELAQEPAHLATMMDGDLLPALIIKADSTQDENTRNFAMRMLYVAACQFPRAVMESGAISHVLQFISCVWQTDGYAVCVIGRVVHHLWDSRRWALIADLVHSDGAITALRTVLERERGEELDAVIDLALDLLDSLMKWADPDDDFHPLLEPSLERIRELADGDHGSGEDDKDEIQALARSLLEQYERLAEL